MRKKGFIILGAILLVILIVIISSIIWYQVSLKQPNKDTNQDLQAVVEIKTGTSTKEILNLLKQNGVIKSPFASKIYIALHEVKSLQAGKYLFTGNETLPEVVNILSSGKVMDETVTITFLEGKNMRYIASTIAEKTDNTINDVYQTLENDEYITSLIDKYWFLTDRIKNSAIYYPLEGYLYPDTYSFENKEVSVETIFEKMLDKMDKVLTKYKGIPNSTGGSYSAHDILTIASIVELEGNNSDNRSKIAKVIYNRLAANMSLGSDVTTYYAIRVDMGERDLYAKEINTYNAYNTRGPNMEGKLPVGPIASVSEESIKAALNPTGEKTLYFVADKNGDIYFSDTYEEHQETIATLKKKGLWYEYNTTATDNSSNTSN